MSAPNRARFLGWGTVAATVAVLGGCTEGGMVAPVDVEPQFVVVGAPACTNTDAEVGKVKLVKVNGSGKFLVSVNGGAPTEVSLDGGDCAIVHVWDSPWTLHRVTISETTQPESIVCEWAGVPESCEFVGDNFAKVLVSGFKGAKVIFTNPPDDGEPLVGRMTGGGFQLKMDGVRITRGFTIHCDVTLTNNLEINWPGGNKWHITKEMIDPTCIDDPNVQPDPPPAPFDTFIATAEGQLNKEAGVSVVNFIFVDAGEPGAKEPCQLGTSPEDPQVCDWASIQVFDPDGIMVLNVSGFLDGGNIQAHYDQPHK